MQGARLPTSVGHGQCRGVLLGRGPGLAGRGFSFQHLEPGRYALVAGPMTLVHAAATERLGITVLEDVAVGAEPSNLDVRSTATGSIVVHVHDTGGAPVAGASVELVGPGPLAPALHFEGLDLRTSSSGTVRLPPFSGGTVRLRASSSDRRGPVTEVVVVPDATAEAQLLLPD